MPISSTARVALIAVPFLLAGCSQAASPTSPTSFVTAEASGAPSQFAATAVSREVPFKGTMQGTDYDSDFTSSTVVVTTEGSGTATQLGQFSFTQRVTLSFETLTAVGTSHWVAGNGDSLDTTVSASGQPTGTPGEFQITDVHTITGGTGRFARAWGTFTVERVASAITFATSGSIDGSISSPGAN